MTTRLLVVCCVDRRRKNSMTGTAGKNLPSLLHHEKRGYLYGYDVPAWYRNEKRVDYKEHSAESMMPGISMDGAGRDRDFC